MWPLLCNKNNIQEIMDDLTIAIIGPYNQRSINNIVNYKKYCKHILVSTWSDMYTDEVEAFKKNIENHKDITLYQAESPSRNDIVHPMFKYYPTLLPQVKGILLAAKACKTKYMIRTRSDASFSDLSRMIIRFSKHHLDTVVSSSVAWRINYNNRPFHMGDHCFITDTETIIKVYQDFYNIRTKVHKSNTRHQFLDACEEYLYYFFRKHNRIPVPINVHHLGKFVVSISGGTYNNHNYSDFQRRFTDIFDDYYNNDDIITWKEHTSKFGFNE
jgi:hypothetical protein